MCSDVALHVRETAALGDINWDVIRFPLPYPHGDDITEEEKARSKLVHEKMKTTPYVPFRVALNLALQLFVPLMEDHPGTVGPPLEGASKLAAWQTLFPTEGRDTMVPCPTPEEIEAFAKDKPYYSFMCFLVQLLDRPEQIKAGVDTYKPPPEWGERAAPDQWQNQWGFPQHDVDTYKASRVETTAGYATLVNSVVYVLRLLTGSKSVDKFAAFIKRTGVNQESRRV